MIYPAKNLKNTLFLDIETVSEQKDYLCSFRSNLRNYGKKKQIISTKPLTPAMKKPSICFIKPKQVFILNFQKLSAFLRLILLHRGLLRIKSFNGHNEGDILNDFAQNAKSPLS